MNTTDLYSDNIMKEYCYLCKICKILQIMRSCQIVVHGNIVTQNKNYSGSTVTVLCVNIFRYNIADMEMGSKSIKWINVRFNKFLF